MIKKVLYIFSILSILFGATAFSQIVELSLDKRIEKATDIFEGKVILSTAFWNANKTVIYTSNIIEVYKVFKGKQGSTEVEVITEGGKIGNSIQSSSESLQLSIGEVGVFLVEPTKEGNPKVGKGGEITFRTYGGTQGFIEYDLVSKTASDPFANYQDVRKDLHDVIVAQTGQSVKVLKSDDFKISKKEKKSFWCRIFKCKSGK